MRARTHDVSCNYGLSSLDGTLPCTCGMSPKALTADQAIRVIALRLALHRNPGASPTGVVAEAQTYENYIRGET